MAVDEELIRDLDPEDEALEEEPARDRQFPCAQCGAKLTFAPGTDSLVCPYCEHAVTIPRSEEDIEELDFRAHLELLAASAETEEHAVVKCDACGAETDRPADVDSFRCLYCDHPIVATATSRKLIKPRALLPFKVTRAEAREAFRSWLKKLWLVPGGLKDQARVDSRLSGVYLPYWTYDAYTTTFYRGMRGDHYYVTQTYTDSKGRMRTRQVQKTRWRPVSGTVARPFDDVLVLASDSLPRKHVEALEPWDLESLSPYEDEFLSGFVAESYRVDLAEGFGAAQGLMWGVIQGDVRADIGGDVQRITSHKTQYDGVSFKHILLPVWVSAFRFKNKVYRFIVNARTGEVKGERPWSAWKIAGLVVLGLAVVGAIALIVAMNKS
ncbi:MAG: hypothetical protein AAGI17_05165 [Planctomycetota bacterium]